MTDILNPVSLLIGATPVDADHPLPVLASMSTEGLATDDQLASVITALASILAKISADPATQTTLAAVLAKLSADPSTATLQTAANTKLDTLHTDLATTLAGLLTTLNTYTDGLEALLNAVATQTTLAAVLAKITADPSTATLQGSANTKLDQLHTDLTAATPAGTNMVGHIGGTDYETVAASQTDQVLGPTGATGDYLSHVTIIPTTTSPGAVSIKDGAGSAVSIFTGGASSVSNLVPFTVGIGAKSAAGAWKITTGANVSVVGFGDFS
jgi:hypothetical protein